MISHFSGLNCTLKVKSKYFYKEHKRISEKYADSPEFNEGETEKRSSLERAMEILKPIKRYGYQSNHVEA